MNLALRHEISVRNPSSFGSLKVKTPLAMAGQRIGIMGGSFNPPHDGHLIVAETALKRLQLDQVWWVVTPGNPLKSNAALPPQAERIALCRKLAQSPRMFVTGFEAELGSPFTAVTVAFLQRRHPAVTFIWVMGADNLAGFHRWQNWRDIASSVPLAIVDRPGWRQKAMSSKAALAMQRNRLPEARALSLARNAPPIWSFLSTRLSPLSSTQIRNKPLTNKEKIKS